MPTIWNERGFIFMIHTNDHEPAHVHAYKAGGVIVINILDLRLQKVIDLKKSDARIAKQIAESHQQLFLQKWREIHDN